MHCANVHKSKQRLKFKRFSCCKKEYSMLETMHLTSFNYDSSVTTKQQHSLLYDENSCTQ